VSGESASFATVEAQSGLAWKLSYYLHTHLFILYTCIYMCISIGMFVSPTRMEVKEETRKSASHAYTCIFIGISVFHPHMYR